MLLPIRPFTRKSPEKINNSDNARVIRITEIYLTNSEANLRGNTTIGATPLAAINKLRTRTGLRALGSVSLDQILNEIRKELAFEGHRKMNLLRNSLNLCRTVMPNMAKPAPGANKILFPIPVVQRDLNPNNDQNPEYSFYKF